MNIQEQPVSIYSQGQRMLADFCLPRGKAPCVVMSHGLESSKDGDKWLVLVPRLCDAGFALLRFSYRGCGEGEAASEGDFAATTLTGRIADYRAALEFARSRDIDPDRLGVIGSSFGSMVALAAGSAGIRAMVILATPFSIPAPEKAAIEHIKEKGYIELGSGRRLHLGFYDDLLRYDMSAAVEKIACPLLIIQGSEDEVVPVDDARHICEHAREPKRLEIIEGADHVFSSPEHLERVINLSLEWFRKYL